LHSSSVVDLFCASTQAFEFINKFSSVESSESKNESIFDRFAEINFVMIKKYSDLILKMAQSIFSPEEKVKNQNKFLQQLEQFRRTVISEFKKKKIDSFWNVPPKICVLLNNINACRLKLDDLVSELESHTLRNPKSDITTIDNSESKENQTQIFSMTFTNLKCCSTFIIDKIVDYMEPFIQSEIENLVQMKEVTDENKVEHLLSYLDEQLDVLSKLLYFDVFTKVLERVWGTIMKDFEEILYPKKEKTVFAITQEQAKKP